MFFFLAIKGDHTENSYRNYLRRRKDFSERCKAPFVWVSKVLTCHGEVLEDWPAVKWIMNQVLGSGHFQARLCGWVQ